MRRLVHLLLAPVLAATLGGSALAVAAPAQAARPYCGITWGSLPERAPAFAPGPVTSVRAGRHPCFDRLVLDLRGPAPGYTVAYVPRIVNEEGRPLPLRGGAFLSITVNAGDPRGTYRWRYGAEMADLAGFRTLREVASGGVFEHHTLVGLGVRARLPFRVFTLAGPGSGSRLVVDVAHRW